MDKAGNVIFALGLDGNHIPALTDGDDGLPKELGVGRGRDDLLQAVPDFGCLDAHMPPDVRKLRRGIVRDLILREDGAVDFVFQVFVGGQGIKQAVQNRLGIILGYKPLDVPGAAQDARDAQKLYGLKASAPVCPFQAGGNIRHIAEGGVPLSGAEVRGGSGLIQQLSNGVQIGFRLERQAGRFAAFTAGTLGKHLQNLAKFQLCQGFLV